MDKEILGFFMEETSQLLHELESTVERLEESEGVFPENELKEFAQKIDRVMGAAKTLEVGAGDWPGVGFIAKVSEACKSMGYQAVALRREALIPIFAGFWAETLEILGEVNGLLTSPEECRAAVAGHSERLQSRLAWLSERVAPTSEEERRKVQDLLKNL